MVGLTISALGAINLAVYLMAVFTKVFDEHKDTVINVTLIITSILLISCFILLFVQ